MSKLVHVSGRRKRAIARATLKEGDGQVRVNGVLLDRFEPEFARLKLKEPLVLAGDLAKKVNISVIVKGGGSQSQIDASRLAIARALLGYSKSESLKKTFLSYDRHLVVADVRRNEPHKPNDSKPRAKRQKSYR